MKFKNTLALGAIALGFVTGLNAQDSAATAVAPVAPAPAAAAPAAPEAPKYGEAEVLEALGWLAGRNMGLDSFGFTSEQLEKVIAGLRLAAADKELPFVREQITPLIQEFVQRKQMEFMEKLRKGNEAEGAAHFAKLAENKAVTLLPSGLAYEILAPGTGAKPVATDNVKVHYTGTLLNGEVFDSSVQRGEPATFVLNQVIPGWTEGVQLIGVGGKIRLHVPAKLGYGEFGRDRIPPAATLVFEVELLEIVPPAPAPAAPEAPAAPAAAPAAPAAQ